MCIRDSNSTNVTVTFTPHGDMPPIPNYGITLTLDIPSSEAHLNWYGRGPGEDYPDRNAATFMGRWHSTVPEQYFHYVVPQDGGHHSDTYQLSITNRKGHGYRITALDAPFVFSALPYSVEQLTEVSHDCDLKEEGKVFLNIDAAIMGIGNSLSLIHI